MGSIVEICNVNVLISSKLERLAVSDEISAAAASTASTVAYPSRLGIS
jgi:hypothetical protein